MPGVTRIGAVVGGFAVGTIARGRPRPGWLTVQLTVATDSNGRQERSVRISDPNFQG